MTGAELEDNSNLTLKGLSARSSACEQRVEEQFKSLRQMIENLVPNNNKDRDDSRNNRDDGLNLSRHTRQQDDNLKHHTFHTQCSVNKVCKLIDNESRENIVSRALVNHLKLSTEPHPNSYNKCQIDKRSSIKVIEICHVPISIEKFYQELCCL